MITSYKSPVAGSVPFDPSNTDLAAQELQGAIEELAGSMFSFRHIVAGKTVRIPFDNQMVLSQELVIEDTGELYVQGEMVVIL